MTMQVVVAEIPDDGLRLTEQMDPAALALETSDVSFVTPLAVSAFFQRHDDDLLVSVEAESELAVTCARCLQTSRRPYHGAFELGIDIQRRLRVDVTDDIRQEVVLSYPMTFLCREDCRGLCPACGQNLNEGPCQCENR